MRLAFWSLVIATLSSGIHASNSEPDCKCVSKILSLITALPDPFSLVWLLICCRGPLILAGRLCRSGMHSTKLFQGGC